MMIWIPGTRCVWKLAVWWRRKYVVNDPTVWGRQFVSRPPETSTHALHYCKDFTPVIAITSEIQLLQTAMGRDVVYIILTLTAVQEASACTSHPCDGCPTRAGCLIGVGLPNAQLARNSGWTSRASSSDRDNVRQYHTRYFVCIK